MRQVFDNVADALTFILVMPLFALGCWLEGFTPS